jgi:small subunit ribosomal protein S2
LASALVRELIDCGVHFGHRTGRWNPKMAPYIFGKRNSIHIIDIRETVKGLLRAKKFLSVVVAAGHDVLIVGTKRQAREVVEKQARRVGMPFVTERWLGGTLTNFKTIRSRLARLEELERLEATGEINNFSKKMKSTIDRERRKIARNLDGIRGMTRLPGALVILDVAREHIAVREAKKLNIPTVCLVDTDGDPDCADIVIPGNDDAMRSVELVVRELADAIDEGKRGRPTQEQAPGEQAGGESARPRRSRRPTITELAEREAGPGAPAQTIEGAETPLEPVGTPMPDPAAPAPTTES